MPNCHFNRNTLNEVKWMPLNGFLSKMFNIKNIKINSIKIKIKMRRFTSNSFNLDICYQVYDPEQQMF